MKTSHALLYIGIAFLAGYLHGISFRRLAFWQRAGVFIKNDEFRIGFFPLTVVIALYALRMVESQIEFHHGLKQGAWPLIWAVIYCWGITSGFGRGKPPRNEIRVQSTHNDSAYSPLTGARDE